MSSTSSKAPARMGVHIIKATTPTQEPEQIKKSDRSEQLTPEDNFFAGDWIDPPARLQGLARLVQDSTILPQCIAAYKQNIAGFGIGIQYREDVEETEAMSAEFDQAEKIIELLTTEQDTKELFEDLIEQRETFGIAYLEVIRNMAGEVVQADLIEDTPSVHKSKPLDPYLTTTYYHKGEPVERLKRFRKYYQQIGDRKVYFKEFGDPRPMDKLTGRYASDATDEDGEPIEVIPLERQANELLEFKIGTKPYGEVRWIGQILGLDGSRRAENLNDNYFINGRHTPLMILLKNGTLTEDSYAKLQQYVDGIRGEAGQHAFMVLEVEGTDGRTDFDAQEKPDVEIKELASILQKDELFQAYMEDNRRKVQSSFLLPDIYTGYTTDFNRATAQTAMEVTEKQVFQPERLSLAWQINNKLLNEYAFKSVECYFKAPDISNPDDQYKLLTVCNNAGGLTPNKAKEILYDAYGETAENYEGDWADLPLSLANKSGGAMDMMMGGLETQIGKAEASNDDEIVAVLKEVRRLLKEAERTQKEQGNVPAVRGAD